MSPRPSDQALRRTVAELASAAPDDVEAVLAGLDPPHRRRVQDLLADYLGEPVESAAAPSARPVSNPTTEGLSPWLASRLGEPTPEPQEAFAITPAAAEALRACAASLEPETAAEAPVPPAQEPTWLHRLLRREAVR